MLEDVVALPPGRLVLAAPAALPTHSATVKRKEALTLHVLTHFNSNSCAMFEDVIFNFAITITVTLILF
jgi:hypothetical protein